MNFSSKENLLSLGHKKGETGNMESRIAFIESIF